MPALLITELERLLFQERTFANPLNERLQRPVELASDSGHSRSAMLKGINPKWPIVDLSTFGSARTYSYRPNVVSEQTVTKFSLSDWANVAEIGASAGVIISLIFVGLQLQTNTEVTEAATREAINQKDLEYLSLRLDSSVLARAYAKLENDEELTPLEESQLVHQEYVNFVNFEHSFYQYRKGNLEQDQWLRHRKIVQSLIEGSPYSRAMWARKHYEFGPDFQVLVDSFVSD